MKHKEILERLAQIQSSCTGKNPFGVMTDLKRLYGELTPEEKIVLMDLLAETTGVDLYMDNVNMFLTSVKIESRDA